MKTSFCNYKWIIHKEDITANIYVSNNRTSKYIKQHLIKLQGEIGNYNYSCWFQNYHLKNDENEWVENKEEYRGHKQYYWAISFN